MVDIYVLLKTLLLVKLKLHLCCSEVHFELFLDNYFKHLKVITSLIHWMLKNGRRSHQNFPIITQSFQRNRRDECLKLFLLVSVNVHIKDPHIRDFLSYTWIHFQPGIQKML